MMEVSKFNKKVGKNIKRLRIDKGIRQDQFADLIDISVGSLIKIESGENGISFETAVKISEVLYLSLYILYEDYKEIE